MKQEKKPENDKKANKNPKDSAKELNDDDLSKVSGGDGTDANHHYDDPSRRN